jgi:hypothetical protein
MQPYSIKGCRELWMKYTVEKRGSTEKERACEWEILGVFGDLGL